MHSAPSVTYPVGRSRFAALALGLVWLAGVAVMGAWLIQVAALGLRHFAALAGTAGCGGLAWMGWLRGPIGELHWDGQSWCWSAGGKRRVGQIAVQLDFQRHLLVRLSSDGAASHWYWLARSDSRPCWDDLRRALYSSRPAAATAPTAARPSAQHLPS